MREVFKDLKDIQLNEPLHKCFTISTALGNGDFDGCVYRDEATIDPDKHEHIPWSDHRFVVLSWRLLSIINREIDNYKIII
uniref:Uncharacterized protein n=1 Tax=viral metagenome TaxID=1070528 RepID=A0A6C0JAZ2_9ZZZZ